MIGSHKWNRESHDKQETAMTTLQNKRSEHKNMNKTQNQGDKKQLKYSKYLLLHFTEVIQVRGDK